jgi:hypothetical protein
MLSSLFQNLREYAIDCNSLNFAEELIPYDLVRSLRSLEFDEAGQELKSILEKYYTDGISGFENVKTENGAITGIFLDKISSNLTKKFEFKVTPKLVTYSVVNPKELTNASHAEIEFAAKKQRNCSLTSLKCGGACLPIQTKSGKRTQCRNYPDAEEEARITALLKKTQPIAPKITISPNTPPVSIIPKEIADLYKAVDKSDHKALIALGENFSQDIIKSLQPTPEELRANEDLITIRNKFNELDDALSKNQKVLVDGKLKKVTSKMLEETRKAYWKQNEFIDTLESARLRKQARQFGELRQSIVNHHNLSKATLNKLTNNKDYFLDNTFTKDAIKSDQKDFFALTGGKGATSIKTYMQSRDRACANPSGLIDVSQEYSKNTLFHEAGHHVEYENNEFLQAANKWRDGRASAPGLVPLNKLVEGGGYDDDEVAVPDKFIAPYVGKVYSNNTTEVISMGLEHFATPNQMRQLHEQDKEHFHLILGMLLAK